MQNNFNRRKVVLGLPSWINYDPGLTHVWLIQRDNNKASGIVSFFDVGRVHGPAGGLVNATLRRACTGLQYLGIQISLRKYQLPSSRPSSWNGGFIYTDTMLPIKLLSQIKWDAWSDASAASIHRSIGCLWCWWYISRRLWLWAQAFESCSDNFYWFLMYWGFRKSSNNREYHNLKNFITEESKSGRLTGRELWICTDN